MWKRHYLSKEEKLTLIKSILSIQPSYLFHIFVCHSKKGELKILEQIQRDFLWGGIWGGGGALVKKLHLVNWAIVCLDKKYG